MLPLVMYATGTSLSFSAILRRMPPMEMTSSSGCGEKQITRRPIGSFDLPRIFDAERVEHGAVHLARRAELCDERRHVRVGVVALRELEDRLVRALRQPDHGAHDQVLRPLHFVEQPRRLDRASALRRRRGRCRTSCWDAAGGTWPRPRRRRHLRRRAARCPPCARRWP